MKDKRRYGFTIFLLLMGLCMAYSIAIRPSVMNAQDSAVYANQGTGDKDKNEDKNKDNNDDTIEDQDEPGDNDGGARNMSIVLRQLVRNFKEQALSGSAKDR